MLKGSIFFFFRDMPAPTKAKIDDNSPYNKKGL
jgi:hypothetical protein